MVAVVTAMAGYEAKELLLLYINEVKYSILIDSKPSLVTLIVLGALNAIFYLKNRRVDRRNVINTLFIMYFMIMLSFTLLPILLPPMHTEEPIGIWIYDI